MNWNYHSASMREIGLRRNHISKVHVRNEFLTGSDLKSSLFFVLNARCKSVSRTRRCPWSRYAHPSVTSSTKCVTPSESPGIRTPESWWIFSVTHIWERSWRRTTRLWNAEKRRFLNCPILPRRRCRPTKRRRYLSG